MSIKIRKALPEDSEALALLFLESRRNAFYWQGIALLKLEDFYKHTDGEVIQSLLSWMPLPYKLKCVTKNDVARAFYSKNG